MRMLGRVGRTQPRTPRIPPKNRRIRARLHITVPTNPPEPRAPSHLCAHESARTTGTFTSLCPRIRQNHGHPHITVPTNPAESWAPSYHCARESSRTMDTFTSLCPRIRPNHGHLHITVPTNPPDFRAFLAIPLPKPPVFRSFSAISALFRGVRPSGTLFDAADRSAGVAQPAGVCHHTP